MTPAAHRAVRSQACSISECHAQPVDIRWFDRAVARARALCALRRRQAVGRVDGRVRAKKCTHEKHWQATNTAWMGRRDRRKTRAATDAVDRCTDPLMIKCTRPYTHPHTDTHPHIHTHLRARVRTYLHARAQHACTRAHSADCEGAHLPELEHARLGESWGPRLLGWLTGRDGELTSP